MRNRYYYRHFGRRNDSYTEPSEFDGKSANELQHMLDTKYSSYSDASPEKRGLKALISMRRAEEERAKNLAVMNDPKANLFDRYAAAKAINPTGDAVGYLVQNEPNNRLLLQEVAKYNARDATLNPLFADYFQRHNRYFEQGQASPGHLSVNLMQAAKKAFDSLPADAQKAYIDAGYSPVELGTKLVKDSASGILKLTNGVDPRAIYAAGTIGQQNVPIPNGEGRVLDLVQHKPVGVHALLGDGRVLDLGQLVRAIEKNSFVPVSGITSLATAPDQYGGPETLYFGDNWATNFSMVPKQKQLAAFSMVPKQKQLAPYTANVQTSAPPANVQTSAPPAKAKGGVVSGRCGIMSLAPRLIKGGGDGMSDDVQGIIVSDTGGEPVLLADGEYIVPADVVSHLGNGSTDAGAKYLDALMAKIRNARTGNSKQAPKINAGGILKGV